MSSFDRDTTIDPELAAVLDKLHSGASVDDIRAPWWKIRDHPSVHTDQRTITRPDGTGDIPVRIYKPAARQRPAPGVMIFHGGAFSVGNLDTEHPHGLRFASDVGCIAVNVDYRLAPQHPFPVGVEDCYAALVWTANHADELGISLDRLAVSGGSAGGGLAAAVALMARDRGGPELAFQLLMYPCLDDRRPAPDERNPNTPIFTSLHEAAMWDTYIGENRGDDISPYAAPSRAENLRGLPPAFILTAEHDPLRDAAVLYGLRLLQAGVPTEIHNYPATFHGFHTYPSSVSKRAYDEICHALARAVAPSDPLP